MQSVYFEWQKEGLMRKSAAVLVCFSELIVIGVLQDIITKEKIEVKLGAAITLDCALRVPSLVVQVTWQRKTDTVLENVATYSTQEGVIIKSGYRDRLNITILELNKTAITFSRVSLEDEGCYQCLFNIFPNGPKQGSTCIYITGDVAAVEEVEARIGTSAVLSCALRKSLDVLQITWQKNTSAGITNLATYSTNEGVKIVSPHKDHLTISLLSLNKTAITLPKTRVQDEGCYHCLFNAYPSGSVRGTTCLHLYDGLWMSLHAKRSQQLLNATCSATSWPAPDLWWPGMGVVLQNGTSKVVNLNGTMSVSSWVLLNDSTSPANATIECRAQNPRQGLTYSVAVNEGSMFRMTMTSILAAVTPTFATLY
ncbi:OX-2 membrane glycoprotein-like isoform X2 [Ambystoma mexicanum]|uniref:OX-2 membrane glycoprotein-like isoform X2 n=1 Tax=Ambystoma mexicanum TaxID=8296 RepID=UPI0037E734A1